jgi:hypothetical protein
MKKMIIFALVLIAGTCAAQNKPFATTYKESGYSITEGFNIVSKDSVLFYEYKRTLEKTAENDGWISHYPGGKIPLAEVAWFIDHLIFGYDTWLYGQLEIGSRNGANIIYFFRPAYADRINKIVGQEPVGKLDVTSILGWTDENNCPYPVRTIMMMRCINSALDKRVVKTKPQTQQQQPPQQKETTHSKGGWAGGTHPLTNWGTPGGGTGGPAGGFSAPTNFGPQGGGRGGFAGGKSAPTNFGNPGGGNGGGAGGTNPETIWGNPGGGNGGGAGGTNPETNWGNPGGGSGGPAGNTNPETNWSNPGGGSGGGAGGTNPETPFGLPGGGIGGHYGPNGYK